MAGKHEIGRADILPMEDYAARRAELKREISGIKRNRRIEVGPFATFYFESYRTMWHQIHEMLYIAKGGEDQIAGELAAYNPLIPKGRELVATVMLEIDEPVRRARVLAGLGGVEHTISLAVASETVTGLAEQDTEGTNTQGKASSIQFIHFPLTAAHVAAFREPAAHVVIAVGHANYGHMTVIPEPVRAALAEDLE